MFADIMIDYSWTECTAACVISLIEIQQIYPGYKSVELKESISAGLAFILKQQKTDGSWYGGWAVCFTYATWFAVDALSKAKAKGYYNDIVLVESMQKAAEFLVKKQKVDGGWGETFKSCSKLVYTEAEKSQVVNTAWALLALLLIEGVDNSVINSGVHLLLCRQTTEGDWEQESISGVFNYNCMITYANYRNIFPIWALSRYYRKTNQK